jgi:fatty-acyl-CoA synthase
MQIVFDFAAKCAELSPDAIAFDEVETGRRLTYAEFNARAERCATWLEGLGIAAGERIAILCHNSATFFEVLFGCGKASVILVPLNWRLTPAELDPILADCGARLLLHDAATAPLAAALAKSSDVPLISFDTYETLIESNLTTLDERGAGSPPPCGEGLGVGGIPTANVLRSPPPCPSPTRGEGTATAREAKKRDTAWPTDRIWYLLYTSGTTGRPKAVIQTVGMALANYVNVQQATGLARDDTSVNFLPLFHTAGINLHTLPVFIAGGTSAVLSKFDIDPLLDLIAEGRVSVFFGVPAIYQALSLSPRFASADLARVRHWGCGGAPLPESLFRAFLAKGVVVCPGMGMTETGPTVFLMRPEEAVHNIGSIGKPHILTEVRLVDLDGRDVPTGERGEILFRGPNITPGYFNNPGATAAAIDEDGWLHSGDVGRRDEAGNYFIVDRIKDMYISGGENVYPAEVEAVLTNHPAVLEAAVIGVTDERWGEVGHAVIRLRPGKTCEAEEVRVFARKELAAYKVPKHVTIVDDYPRTAAGKVQKHILRQSIAGRG